jgi:hypothetical protein
MSFESSHRNPSLSDSGIKNIRDNALNTRSSTIGNAGIWGAADQAAFKSIQSATAFAATGLHSLEIAGLTGATKAEDRPPESDDRRDRDVKDRQQYNPDGVQPKKS